MTDCVICGKENINETHQAQNTRDYACERCYEQGQVLTIVEALKSADSGQIIYDALLEVPPENLRDMRNMINDILENKGK